MHQIDEILSEYYVQSDYELESLINESDTEKNPDRDTEEKQPYFFKTILMFTNSRDPKENKTLNNLQEAIDGTSISLKIFIADEVSYQETDKGIHIEDSKEKYDIKDDSNIDTIVITRLSAKESNECSECVKALQDLGLFVMNPIESAEIASNKYQTAILLDKYGVPQPKFTLVDKNDLENGKESLNEKLKAIYEDVGKDDESKEYVVKILDGHGGTGVFIVNGKNILSILQAMFAVDEELELLVQKKEEADGGDIRVHVLTLRTEQKILASMKRKQLSGDFRSNVSLGAKAEKVVITEAQKEIALKVGKISGMPWCAVDIMPLVKGTNPELGDNAVLEYNSSPGTEGISEVINKNFMKVLLDSINDVNELVLEPKAIGYIEDILLTFKDGDGPVKLSVKLDTGNGSKASTIGCEKIEVDGDNITATIEGKKYEFKRYGQSMPKVGQTKEVRETILIPCIQLGARKLLNVEFALVDNRNKSTKVLLNRDVISKLAYLVDAGKKHTLGEISQEK